MSKLQVEQIGVDAAGGVPVGTIVTNIAQDMGEKYLPCDGRTLPPDSYPDLQAMLPEPSNLGDTWGNIAKGSGYGKYAYGGGLFGYLKDGKAWFAEGADGPWTGVVIGDSPVLMKLKYIHGYWILLEQYAIYVAKGDPRGSWEKIDGVGCDSTSHDIDYGDGYWVISDVYKGYKAYSLRFTYLNSEDPTSPGWTAWNSGITTQNWSSSMYSQVAYGNGYWVISAWWSTGEHWVCNGAPSGSWSKLALSSTHTVKTIHFVNGKFIGDGEFSPDRSMWFADEPLGDDALTQIAVVGDFVSFANGHWFASGEKTYIAETIDGPWEELEGIGADAKAVIWGNGFYACGSKYLRLWKKIPAVQPEAGNAFILAKQ